jgi:hypothetical protein
MWSPFSASRRTSQSRLAPRKLRLETLEERDVPSAFATSVNSPDLSRQLVGSGQGVGTDGLGNVYAVGYVGGGLSSSDTDGYVTKYSPDGVPQWTQMVQGLVDGTSLADSADAIAVDRAGNSYVTGNFRGTLQLGNFSITSTGSLDVFVEKLDTNGNVLWVHQFANTGNFGPPKFDHLGTCSPKSIAIDKAGEVVVTGIFTGHMDTDPANPGQHFLDYPNNHPGGYVVELDASGNFKWQAEAINPPDNINADAVAMDRNANVYVLGDYGNFNYFNDKTAHNSDQKNAHSLTLTGPNITNLYLWKLNANGTNAWVREIGSSAQFTATNTRSLIWGLGLAINPHGIIYATGAFDGTSVNFNPTDSTHNPHDFAKSASGNFDTFIERLDLAGNFKWVRQIVSSGDNWGYGVALDTAGNPYITGYLTAASKAGNFLLTPTSSASNGYVAELNLAGKFVCAEKSKDLSAAGDQSAAIAVDALGFVDMVGTYTSQMQWPSLPLLDSPGGTGLSVVKTMLTCPTPPPIKGGVVDLSGLASVNPIVITDDRNWGILVQLGDGTVFAYSGVTEVDFTAGTGDHQVTVTLGNSAAPPPSNWKFHFGDGNNALTFMVSGAGSAFANWDCNLVVDAGKGNHMLDESVTGSATVNLKTNFGAP